MKTQILRIGSSLGVFAAALATSLAQSPEQRDYLIRKLAEAPTLDGIASPGEWDGADVGTDFRQRQTQAVVPHSVEFRMGWTDEALYLLYVNGQASFSSGTGFGDDDLNLYIDPDTDDEEQLDKNGFPLGTPPDGYQISVWMNPGDVSRTGAARIFTEAHGDTPFGNNAGWDGGALPKAGGWDYFSEVVGGSGVIEMCIPWTDFSADPGGVYGLNHTSAPEAGDDWYFQLSHNASNTNGLLYSYNYSGEASFAAPPHARGEFVESAVSPSCSQFYITSIEPIAKTELKRIHMRAVATGPAVLTVECSNDLGGIDPWTPVEATVTPLAGNEYELSIDVPLTETRRFCRLLCDLPDGD